MTIGPYPYVMGRNPVDVAMPALSGIEAARQIGPRTALVFLSMHSDESYVLRALKSGARGYLLKDSAEHDLIHANCGSRR